MSVLQILIVDDHEAVRGSIRSFLSRRNDWLVCGEAADGIEAVECAKKLRPDLVLMDISMPNMDGFEATRIIRREVPQSEVIVISQNDPVMMVRQAAEVDARAFIAKTDLPRDLIPAIDRVMASRKETSTIAVKAAELPGPDLASPELADRLAGLQAMQECQEGLAADLAATQRLQEVSTQLIQEDRAETLYQQIVDAAAAIMRSEYASIQMFYPERGAIGELRLLGHRGFTPEAAKFWEWMRPGSQTTCGLAFRVGQRIIVPDVQTCNFLADTDDLKMYRQAGIRAVQSTPLISRSGRLLGMISTHWREPHLPLEREFRLLDVLARQAADLIERKRTEETLRASEERSRMALNASRTVAWSWDLRTDELRQSENVGAVIGLSEVEHISTGWKAVHTEDLPRLQETVQRAIAAHGEYQIDFRVIRLDNGDLVWLHARGKVECDPSGTPIRIAGTATDITERKRVEEELAEGLRQQKALFQLADQLHRAESLGQVYDAALDAILSALQCDRAAILLSDDSGEMRFVNWRGLSDVYREAIHEVVRGRSPWAAGEKRPEPICIVDIDASKLGEPLLSIIHSEGIRALAFIPLVSDGEIIGKFMIYSNAPHVFSKKELEIGLTIGRQLVFGIDRKRAGQALRKSEEGFRSLAERLDTEVRARTAELERRNAEVLEQSEQLRDLSAHLLQIQDEERRHIARELHDSVGQTLAVLGINLATLLEHAKNIAPHLAQQVRDSQQFVQQLNQGIRTMSYLLHPPLLDEGGLFPALGWYVQGLTERSGLDIDLSIPKDFGRLSRDMELVVFRIVQESLTNIHRHSGSKIAAIRLRRSAEAVFLEVEDQGKGIPPEKLKEIQVHSSGVGIRGMRERVRQFQGQMDIHSSDRGAKISVTLPVAKSGHLEARIPEQGLRLST